MQMLLVLIWMGLVMFKQGSPSVEIQHTDEIILSEDPELPIRSITGLVVSPNGKLLLVVDRENGCAYVYDLKGKLQTTLRTEPSFSDSLAINGRWPKPDAVHRASEVGDRPFQNTIQSAIFINDSQVLAGAYLRCLLVPQDGNRQPITALHSAFVKYSLISNTCQVHPVEWQDADYAPQVSQLALDRATSEVVVPVKINFNGSIRRGRLDSTFCTGRYTLEGSFRGFEKSWLPSESITHYIAPSMLTPLLGLDQKGNVLVGYEEIPRILKGANVAVELVKLSANNSEFYSGFKRYLDTHPRGSDIPWDSLSALKPFFLMGFQTTNDGLFVTSGERVSYSPWTMNFVIQKYDLEGHYLSETGFTSNGNEIYRYATYSPATSSYYGCALKADKRWVIRVTAE